MFRNDSKGPLICPVSAQKRLLHTDHDVQTVAHTKAKRMEQHLHLHARQSKSFFSHFTARLLRSPSLAFFICGESQIADMTALR